MKSENFRVNPDGTFELTDKGRAEVAKHILDSIKIDSQPKPYSMAYMAKLATNAMTGRFSVKNPPMHDPRKDSMDKPKIPFSGMAGFSERGTPEDWDLAIGEVYGYRWWKINVPARLAGYARAPEAPSTDGTIIGANNQLWDSGRVEAVCTRTQAFRVPSWDDLIDGTGKPFEHEPPEVRQACGCGYWAYFDQFLPVNSHFSMLASRKPHRPDTYWVELPVFGVIKGSGRVIIGEKGFRSQYAEIVGLCLPEIAQDQLSWWTTEYQIGHKPSVLSDIVRNTTFYQAAMGPQGWYTVGDVWDESSRVDTVPATQNEVLQRVSYVEELLARKYPEAKLMSTQDGLRAYFPPDKRYS